MADAAQPASTTGKLWPGLAEGVRVQRAGPGVAGASARALLLLLGSRGWGGGGAWAHLLPGAGQRVRVASQEERLECVGGGGARRMGPLQDLLHAAQVRRLQGDPTRGSRPSATGQGVKQQTGSGPLQGWAELRIVSLRFSLNPAIQAEVSEFCATELHVQAPR